MSYQVWCPEIGQTINDARRIDAFSAENAAEKWAQDYDRDSSEYTIVGGQEMRVIVRENGDASTDRIFVVSGYAVPDYMAMEEF